MQLRSQLTGNRRYQFQVTFQDRLHPVAKGGHYHPANYDKNSFKIVFTRVDLRTDKEVEGRVLILNIVKRTPIAEVKVDLTQNRVSEIADPATAIKYEDIPVAIY